MFKNHFKNFVNTFQSIYIYIFRYKTISKNIPAIFNFKNNLKERERDNFKKKIFFKRAPLQNYFSSPSASGEGNVS